MDEFITSSNLYPLEKTLQNSIMRYLNKDKNIWAIKIHGNEFQKVGTPDILGCYRGRFFAIEVKTHRGRVTPIQAFRIREIADAQGATCVARSLDDAKRFIASLENFEISR